MIACSISRSLFANVESNFAPRLFRRSHQLPDRFKDRADLLVMFTNAFFEFGKFVRELAICFQRLAQLYERPYNRDVHFHRTLTVQDARQHGEALFGESVGEMAPSALAF